MMTVQHQGLSRDKTGQLETQYEFCGARQTR